MRLIGAKYARTRRVIGTIAARSGMVLMKRSPLERKTQSGWHCAPAALLRCLAAGLRSLALRYRQLYPWLDLTTRFWSPNQRWELACSRVLKSNKADICSPVPYQVMPGFDHDQP